MVGGLGTEKVNPAREVSKYTGGGERGNRLKEVIDRVKGDERKAMAKQRGDTSSMTIHDFIPS